MWWAVVAWRVGVVVVGFIRGAVLSLSRRRGLRGRDDDDGLQRGIREVAGTVSRRQAEGVRMIATAAGREVAAPQVLVGEGQRE
jgi:hypothetical protein